MGKIEEFVQQREQEKHITTAEFLKTLTWYIESTEKVRRDYIEAQSSLNEAFNARLKELNGGKQPETITVG